MNEDTLTIKKAAQAVWDKIKEQDLKVDHAVTIQYVIHDVNLQNNYESDIISNSIDYLVEKNWLLKRSVSVYVLTEIGYANL